MAADESPREAEPKTIFGRLRRWRQAPEHRRSAIIIGWIALIAGSFLSIYGFVSLGNTSSSDWLQLVIVALGATIAWDATTFISPAFESWLSRSPLSYLKQEAVFLAFLAAGFVAAAGWQRVTG